MSTALPVTPWGPIETDVPPGQTAQRILDAAARLFEARGISATTVEQIAREAGISRVWLYRHFANRDAIVRSLLSREAMRLLAGLAPRVGPGSDPVEAAIEVAATALEQICQKPLVRKLLETEHDILLPFLTTRAGPLLEFWVRAAARYFVDAVQLDAADALVVAEWLVRVATSVLLTPIAAVDLDNPRTLRRFVAGGIQALVRHHTEGGTNRPVSGSHRVAPASGGVGPRSDPRASTHD